MELKELNTVCDLQNGYAFKSSDYVDFSNTLSLRMSNIRPGGVFDNSYNLRYLPDDFQEKYSNYLVKDGDLVIAMTDLANDPKILGVPAIVETGDKVWLLNQRAGKLLIKDSSKTHEKYLRYILNHPIHKNYYKMFAGGGLQINVGKKEILGVKIPLPNIDSQKRIAAILDDAQALKQKTEQLLDEYDELAQSIFLDMFGDPVTNPKKWEFTTVSEILKSKSQNGHYAPKNEYNDNGVEMVHMSDAFYQIVTPGNLKKVNADDKLIAKYNLNSTDLLISRRSLNYEGAAKPCIVPEYDEPLIYESSLIRLRPDLEKVNTLFLFYYFSNDRARSKYIFKHVTKSTISGINNKGLNAIEIYVPPIQNQNHFAEKIILIEQQKELAKQELKESEDLFNCLLQKAFKGELN